VTKTIFLSLFTAFFALNSPAEEPLPSVMRPDEAFQKGIQQFQAGQLDAASQLFRQVVDQEPYNPRALLNWGLTEYKLGRRGLGLAAWRRALAVDPGFSPAKMALDFGLKELNLQKARAGLWERLRHNILNHFALEQLLGASGILMLFSGWLLIRYLGRRKSALETESPLPAWPTVGLVLSSFFLLAMAVTALKGIDLLLPRATVIVSSLPVRSAPTEASSTLFEIAEGSDVILRQTKKGWTQIRSPGGMSGWVVESSLFPTSGRLLW